MIPVLNIILDSVVDTIVPPTPAFENFVYHWEKFMVNYLEWTTDGKCSQTRIEQTNVPNHLEIVQQLLISEDKNEEITTNSCMEYVLKNNLFNILAIIAEKEKLSGIRVLILKFMTNLISQLRNPVLAHNSIFGPINKLINLCNWVLYNEWQQDQIQFLNTLCNLLNKRQNIAIMFFSYEADIYTVEASESPSKLPNELNILDCLLSYINTKDTEVLCKCCDSILLLTKLNDENVIDSIIKKTHLCSTLSTHLRNLYCLLPTTLDYNGLETIELNWRDDYNATYSNDVTKFFCWLNFIVEIIRDGQLKLSCSMCESLKFIFLNKLFNTTREISSKVFLLKKTYKAALYTPLNYTINNWLRSELDCPYYCNQTPIDILIKLSSTEDNVFVFHILNFFADLLNNLDQEILDFMILRFVNNRNYYERCISGSWSDEEDEREKKLQIDKSNIQTSRTLAPSNIDKIINRLLALIPQNLQSDPLHTFKDHIMSTKIIYEDILVKCKKFNWPSEALDSVQLYDFDEGPFLNMIFRKISNIPKQQNSSIAMQLKNILIFLSFLPHPYLHEYLLNSTLPLKRNVSPVYTILCQVFKELHKDILTIPNYNDELIQARKNVLNSTSKTLLNEKNNKAKIFDNAIILEELCKELIAILFVKYHHSNSA